MKPEDLKCPECGGEEFFEGPHGGASVNVMCAGCMHTYNWMGPFGLQPIPEVAGVYNRDRPRALRTFMSATQAIISLGMRIEELEREVVACRGIIATDTETVNQQHARIAFLEEAAMNMQRDVAAERAAHALLQQRHQELERRYDLLMQRQ